MHEAYVANKDIYLTVLKINKAIAIYPHLHIVYQIAGAMTEGQWCPWGDDSADKAILLSKAWTRV